MNRAARWNKEQNKTAKASQGGFWSLVERAGNSPVVAAINEIGDTVAHTVMDMVNPVKQFKTAMADADESIHAFQSGNILQGIASTGKTVLDLLPFVPLEGFAVGAVRYGVAEVGARVGVFRGEVLLLRILVNRFREAYLICFLYRLKLKASGCIILKPPGR
ncbi:MAG: hypothetical protein WC627_06125 [Legionella sp.]|jgi:hypothetical protein